MNSKPKMALWAVCLFAITLFPKTGLAQQEITVSTANIDEVLEPGQTVTVNVTITNDGDAPLNWSSALDDVYGRGPGVVFSKANFANWIIPSNQDRISNNVWIARADNKSIFNAKSETTSDDNSPSDTEWALGGLNDGGSFDTFKNMHGGDPQSLIGGTATLHAISDNNYYELDFSSWTGGNSGGGFGYTRHYMYEYLSFNSITSGTLAPAEQVILAIEISAQDIESAMYSGSLTITSDDADEGTIVIPIGLEVMDAATFELSSTSFSQTVNTGDAPATQMLTISNNGASALNWSSNETSTRPSEMSGVTLNNFSGTVAAGESEVVEISFSDNGNSEGSYEWPLALFSNDPDNDVEIVTISLEIIGEALIDYDIPEPFEDTFIGTTSNGTFRIYNEGTADLNVSDIVSSASQFVATATQFTIAPGESVEVTILFAPDATGTFSGDLTITSNDTETPSAVVAVSGDGIATPEMSVSPLSITESITTAGTPSNTVTVSNSGDGELEWTVNINAGALEPTGTFFEKDDYADISLEANQDRISATVWLARGSSQPIFNYFEETSWSESTATIEWADGPTAEVGPDDYSSISDVLNGNIGNVITGKTLSLHLIDEDRYFDLEFHSWTRNSNGGGHSYTRREVVQWLNVDETIVEGDANITAADASTMFDLDIDGSLMFEGDFVGTATISSNDPLEPEQVITVNVSVTGTPDITATATTASTAVESGSAIVIEIPIENSGDGFLEVTNITSDNAVLVPSETAFSIPPFSAYIVEATFSPQAVQIYDIDLTVASDDPVSPSLVIDVTAEGLPIPTFTITETTFSETLVAGSSTTASFTIENTGAGTLNWDVGEVYFSKANNADASLEENQDRIKEDVWITRNDYEPIFNYFEIDDYNRNSTTIMYGDGQTSTLSFSEYTPDFQDATGNCGSCLEGNTLSLYLVDYDEYYDLDISTWQSDGGGGAVSYLRRIASPWLSLDTYNASLGTEGTSVVTVTFDANNVNAGTYTFSYDVLTNDPANPSTTITFNLVVTGTPELTYEGGTVGFGDEFLGETSTTEMSIYNTGSEVLNVTDITFDDAAFVATSTTASIAPGESATVELTFSPTMEQAYSATGTIVSDDPVSPSTTFSVTGNGVAIPDVAIDISSITAELLSGGVIEKSFTITNNGANSANWSIDKIAVAGTDEVIFEKENFADWTLAENQDRVSESLWITRADDQGLFNAALETDYTNGDRRRERIAIVIEGPENDPFDASPHGTLWAYGRTLDQNRYESWRNAADGDAADLPGEILSMWDVVEDKYYDVEFLSWTSGGGCCGNPVMGGGFSYRRYESLTWLNNFSNTEGTLDAASSEEVTFDVSAEGVSAGDYEAVVTISDGLSSADITVSLTVLGLPEIFVEDEAVDFESIFIGTESTKELAIGNNGLADLEITSITSDNSAYTVSNVPSVIGLDEYAFFEVTFAPSEAISYNAVLTITSNDGTSSNLTIDLSGSGANPPVLGVDKTSLDETLFFGASGSQTFTISNTGDADLEWNLGLSGGTVVFSRADNVDWTLAENQDRITDDVWITRGSSRGIFNIAQEDEFDRNTDVSPAGTLWAYGATGETEEIGEGPCCLIDRVAEAVSENYSDWRDVVGGNPSSENTYSMYLTDHDLYFDVVFAYWAQGNDDGQGSTGGFTYERTPAFYEYEAVSFSATEGVVEPGKSQEVTVFFNPSGTFDGRFELPLQVESNDPSGPAEIPLTLNVNGIIAVNPIEDQLEIEGFGTSAFDISNMFADAQDDPLTLSIASSNDGIVSAAESGGTLTVTEVGIGTAVISVTAEDGKGSSDTFEFDFRVNSIPVINNGLEDQSFENGFGTSVINISAVFGDADEDDELTVEASTSASGVVDVSLSGDVLTLTEVGPGTVDVTLTANDGFGGEVSDVFEVFVNKINQTITFDALSAVPEDIGTVELTATASSSLAVSYSSSNTAVATVSGNTLTILSDGQTTITASQAGDAEYNAAASVDQSLTVENVLSASDLESVEIYPNPVQDVLSITNSSATKIEIYHLDGKLVLTQEVADKANLSDLDEGVYLIKLKDKDDNELYKGRLVKN